MPPPVPRETASAPPIDTIRASSVALSVTAPPAVTLEPALMWASVLLRMTLIARAPAPAVPVPPWAHPTPTTAVPMLALFRASTPTVPFTAIVVFSTTDRASAWMSL